MSDLTASLLIVAALNIWVAWRYARQDMGPDEGIWCLWGCTGAVPYRDFVDCKPPGIHLWMKALALLTGKRIGAMKFLHHLFMGGICVSAMTIKAGIQSDVFPNGALSLGLAATVMLQSAWLRAYQSWMDALSGGFLLLAVLLPPWPSALCIALAVLFNVKAIAPGGIWMLLNGWWMPIAAGCLAAGMMALIWHWRWPRGFIRMWYAVLEVPAAMRIHRKQFPTDWEVWHVYWALPLVLLIPLVASCLWAHPALPLWAMVIAYGAFNAWGRVWRPNHWLPLAVIAAATPPLPIAVLVMLADWLSCKLFTGNIWLTTYPGLAQDLAHARLLGNLLRGEEGHLCLNTFHTQIYCYAENPPRMGMVEQLEIRDVTIPLRHRQRDYLMKHPPDWVVIGPGAIQPDAISGYRPVAEVGRFALLGRTLPAGLRAIGGD